MTTLMTLLKAFRFLWPFITEMFFAGKTFKQIVVENKFVSLLIVLLMGSVTLNYLSFSKIYEIAIARREEDNGSEIKNKKNRDKPLPTIPRPPKDESSTVDSDSQPAHDDVRRRLREIYGETNK